MNEKYLFIALSGYLPYGLMIEQVSKPSFIGQPNNVCDVKLTVHNIQQFIGKKPYRVISQKPWLFSISCLTQQITINGETFCPIEKLKSMGIVDHIDWCTEEREYLIKDRGFYGWLGEIPFKIIEILNSWFIDYRGLIEAGKAIDVTTLKENPYA